MTLVYRVRLTGAAQRHLKRLSKQMFRRVIPRVRELSEVPRPRGCRKISGSSRDWRIRVGSYRILYQIDDEAREVRVMAVLPRPEAYR